MTDKEKRNDEESTNGNGKGLEDTLNELGENVSKFMESVLEKGEELLGEAGLDDIFTPPDDESSTGTRRDSRTEARPEKTQFREPVVDVFDEEEEIVIYVELPGIDEETLGVHLHKNAIYVEAEADRDVFEKKIPLPAEVVPEPAYHFKNGILKIELKKEKSTSKK